MESEYSFLCSQEPATGPYFEAVKYSSFLKYYFFKIHINIILRSELIYIYISIYIDRLCGLVVRVRFPALPDFVRSIWSGTGSTQPREYN
jgi:hypothetical protein